MNNSNLPKFLYIQFEFMNIMNLFKHNKTKLEYSKVSGEFLNKHPELHKYPDFKFNDNSIYHCMKNEQGIIIDFEEF